MEKARVRELRARERESEIATSYGALYHVISNVRSISVACITIISYFREEQENVSRSFPIAFPVFF